MKLLVTLAMGALGASFSFGNSLFLDASDFNAFVRNGFTGLNSDVQGRVAIGGDFTVQNYSIASSLGSYSGDSLIVDGHFSYTNGQVFNGNVTTADTAPTTSGFSVLNGTFHTGVGSSIVIPELFTELVARSGYVGSLAANGNTTLSFGTLTLNGGTGTTRFYNVAAAQLAATTSFVLDAPAGTTAVINVSGTTTSFQNSGFSLTGGVTGDDVLFNFWGAKSLSMAGVGIQGSIFAPQADVTFSNGQLNGQLIANSFSGGGELHLNSFNGSVPVPEPAALSVLAIGFVGLVVRRRKR